MRGFSDPVAFSGLWRTRAPRASVQVQTSPCGEREVALTCYNAAMGFRLIAIGLFSAALIVPAAATCGTRGGPGYRGSGGNASVGGTLVQRVATRRRLGARLSWSTRAPRRPGTV